MYFFTLMKKKKKKKGKLEEKLKNSGAESASGE